jgi:hypothetical protein
MQNCIRKGCINIFEFLPKHIHVGSIFNMESSNFLMTIIITILILYSSILDASFNEIEEIGNLCVQLEAIYG